MHPRNPIVNIPLLIGIGLSVALHGVILYSKGIYTPPVPMLEQGQTVVHLTLAPSIIRQAAAPEAPPEKPREKPPEKPIEEQKEEPVPVPIPIEIPIEQPQKPEIEAEIIAKKPIEATPEQDASLTEEKGVVAEAQPVKTVKPTYPRISRRRGEEGTVTLLIEVLKNGRAGKISVIESSGHPRLDKSALQAIRKTQFVPATQFGKRIDSIITLSYTFHLADN